MLIEALIITIVTLVFCLLTMVVFDGLTWFDYMEEWLKQPHTNFVRSRKW